VIIGIDLASSPETHASLLLLNHFAWKTVKYTKFTQWPFQQDPSKSGNPPPSSTADMSVADFLAATPPDDLMASICFSDSVMLLAQVEVRPGKMYLGTKTTQGRSCCVVF